MKITTVLILTKKSNKLSYVYFEVLLHCWSQSVLSSMKRVPKVVALINRGLLAHLFERRRMGHFQMYRQSWPTVLYPVLIASPVGLQPQDGPQSPSAQGHSERTRQWSQVAARETPTQHKEGRCSRGSRGPERQCHLCLWRYPKPA